jgi:hypothetical protein
VLQPGEAGDPLDISLTTVHMADAPPYIAVSYVWGANCTLTTILVDDFAMAVKPNLHDALEAVRRPDTKTFVWADAMCINQSDKNEINHQISMMTQIYENAESVAVYLGKPTEKTEDAMEFLRHLFSRKFGTIEPPWSYRTLFETEDTLRDIFNRPWFTRVWVVMEAISARHITFICGDDEILWPVNVRTLRRIILYIKIAAISPYFTFPSGHKSNLDWSLLLDILETQLFLAAEKEGVVVRWTKVDIAFRFRQRMCGNPLDCYFAIFRIMLNEDGSCRKFPLDYSLSEEELYRQFVEECLRVMELEDSQYWSTMNKTS